MKKITLILLLSMVITLSTEAHKHKHMKKHVNVTISIQTFYDQLSPYGDWIYTQDNGYVWRPYFEHPEAFRPYSSNGNWVYTEYGWTWASGYSWGWAAFHYGRWDFDNYLGWMWIPGYDWAPAWVTWGSYNNYWGWAPMGPNIYVQSNWFAPDPWWTFVPQNQFCSNDWNYYIYNRPVHATNITYITNIYVEGNDHYNNTHNSWYHGPRVNDVEKYSRSRVARMEVGESQRPEKAGVHKNRLDVYRPTVESKRNDSRPGEYRNVEQARTGNRIEQSNARANNPGVNHTRESRNADHSSTQMLQQRNANSTRVAQVEPRVSTQAPNSRNAEVTRNARENSRTATQTETRNAVTEKRTQVEQRNGSQTSQGRNSTHQAVETPKGSVDHKSRIDITEGNRPIANTNRVENRESNQPRNSAPSRENANNTSPRQSEGRQANTDQPKREQRMQNDAPASTPRTQNTERKDALKEEVKQGESKKAAEKTERSTSVVPSRR